MRKFFIVLIRTIRHDLKTYPARITAMNLLFLCYSKTFFATDRVFDVPTHQLTWRSRILKWTFQWQGSTIETTDWDLGCGSIDVKVEYRQVEKKSTMKSLSLPSNQGLRSPRIDNSKQKWMHDSKLERRESTSVLQKAHSSKTKKSDLSIGFNTTNAKPCFMQGNDEHMKV